MPKQIPWSSLRSGVILIAMLVVYAMSTRDPDQTPARTSHLAALDTTALFTELTVFDSFELCGTQLASNFIGNYEPLETENSDWLTGFQVSGTRITSGTLPVQEFCFVRILTDSEEELRALSVWHEDKDDPGDASLVIVGLRHVGAEVVFTLAEPEPEAVPEFPVRLRTTS